METIFIKLIRCKYTATFTSGKMYINNKFFGFTLENPVMPPGIKVKEETAIYPGDYGVVVRRDRGGNKKVYINNVPLFTGIQCHGGNSVEDTKGCPLVAKTRPSTDTIQGSLEDELIKKVEDADEAYITVINLNQLQP